MLSQVNHTRLALRARHPPLAGEDKREYGTCVAIISAVIPVSLNNMPDCAARVLVDGEAIDRTIPRDIEPCCKKAEWSGDNAD
jgi:hypothetical protein